MKNLLKKNFFHELRNPIGKLGNSKSNSLSFNNNIRITDKSQNSNEIYKTLKNIKEKYSFLNQPYLTSRSNENNNYRKISTLENENLLSSRIESIINSNLNEAFFVYDPSSVINQYKKWKKLLPRFETFYAIKCNNDPNILDTMKHLNMSYDCASLEEIKTALKNGTDPEKIIFANPCKQINHINKVMRINATYSASCPS